MSTDRPTTSGLGLPGRRLDDLPRLQTETPNVLRGSGDEPAPGSGGDEGSALASAAALRFPDLRELGGRARIDALIDHITATAIARSEVEELRLHAHIKLRDAQAELARTTTAVVSPKAAMEAKRQVRPDLAEAVDGGRWLVDRCGEQINRLERDYDAASRAYTLLAGS